MATIEYWATFRIAADATYEKRYQSMLTAMTKVRNGSWADPTSFWIFDSPYAIVPIAKAMTAGLNPRTDLFIIHILHRPVCVYFGKVNLLLFLEHAPYAKKLV